MTEPHKDWQRTADNMLLLTATLLGTTVDEIRSPSRRQPTMTARHISVYLMRKHLPRFGFERIAHFFGRHHSTAIHSARVIQDALDTGEPGIVAAVKHLEEAIARGDIDGDYEREMDEVAERVARRALA